MQMIRKRWVILLAVVAALVLTGVASAGVPAVHVYPAKGTQDKTLNIKYRTTGTFEHVLIRSDTSVIGDFWTSTHTSGNRTVAWDPPAGISGLDYEVCVTPWNTTRHGARVCAPLKLARVFESTLLTADYLVESVGIIVSGRQVTVLYADCQPEAIPIKWNPKTFLSSDFACVLSVKDPTGGDEGATLFVHIHLTGETTFTWMCQRGLCAQPQG